MRKNSLKTIYNSVDFQSARHKLAEFPFLVDVELTNNCNLKCLFCPAAMAMTRARGFMSKDTFKKIVNECTKHKTPIRFIRWGEPFLHPEIIDFIKYVKSKGLLLHITNNGLAIKEKHMEVLIELEVDSIIFSMQGATKEEYKAMRDNDKYDELEANIHRLIELRGTKDKPFIQITSTMLDDKPEDIEAFRKYWEGIVDGVEIGKTVPFWNPARLRKLYGVKYRPCTEVYQKLSVDWDGKISACCGDYDNLLTIGDINESTLSGVWKGEKLNAIRTLLKNNMQRCLTKCSVCEKAYGF